LVPNNIQKKWVVMRCYSYVPVISCYLFVGKNTSRQNMQYKKLSLSVVLKCDMMNDAGFLEFLECLLLMIDTEMK
jgi:hypothetical protein